MKWNLILPCLAALLILGIAGVAALHGSSIAVLNPMGIVGLQERSLFLITLGLCALVVVPVFFMLFIFAWKYRADSPNAMVKHAPNWDHDSWWTAEWVWWIVPSAIIFALSLLIWQGAHRLDPFRPLASQNAPITVQVVALDWKWLFIYPAQGIASVNMLEFPANTPIHFEITADAPMNSFWIPSLGGQIMAMPGMSNQLNLMASTEGNFDGVSANLSGAGFSDMSFVAKSVSNADFDAWVQSAARAQPLTPAAYTALAKPSSGNPPALYSSPDANLYTSIIMTYTTPHADPMP
jgi:cytochrome o ubiquinol oxidase subunit 2